MRVVLRIDSDLPVSEGIILDNSRLKKSVETIRLLLQKRCRIIILGHMGRPQKREAVYSLKPVYLELMSLLEPEGENTIDSVFVEEIDKKIIEKGLEINQIVFLENMRFWKEEEEGDFSFLEPIIKLAQAYVNDAFAVAHRKNASTMLWQKIPGYYGLSFVAEAEKILKVIKEPRRPLTVVLGGAKKDKLDYLPELSKIADHVLVGGKLPKIIEGDKGEAVVAELKDDGLDLSDNDIEKFKDIIKKSKTIIWAGAMGYYELEDNRKGTEEIARAIAESETYKVIAGGDTGASILKLGLSNKIDLVASGGGVMLELLTKGSLPTFE